MYISHKSDNSSLFDQLASLDMAYPVRTLERKGDHPFILKIMDLGAFYGD